MSEREFRDYSPKRDREAVRRVYRECGWLDKGKEPALEALLKGSRAIVAEVNAEAECVVLTAQGTMRYLDEDLPASFVTGVTTSRVARKQGLASELTARCVARDAAEGSLVSCLGMFEQGYYDRLGFSTGGYEHWYAFDPAELTLVAKPRAPRRIAADDWKAVHAARLRRRRVHGGCNLSAPELTKGEMLWTTNGFGLGYFDGRRGALSHYVWCDGKESEHGPYTISWIVFRTREEFLELMGLVKSLGDQVHLVRMQEPPGIQLQDLLRQPFKARQVTERAKYETKLSATAYWQARICDLAGCLERTHLDGEPVRFNLVLVDPIESLLPKRTDWRGVGGEYVVTLGPASGAEPGKSRSLPTLKASVGAFTRLWLGVRPATGLSFTDSLAGSGSLLEALDEVLRLPEPKPDWDF
jgi:hypothetical protein